MILTGKIGCHSSGNLEENRMTERRSDPSTVLGHGVGLVEIDYYVDVQ